MKKGYVWITVDIRHCAVPRVTKFKSDVNKIHKSGVGSTHFV
jgi:hypothetical protein